jgi:hypothetical protein
MSPTTSEIENSLQNLPENIRDKCIMAIKNKSNNQWHSNNEGKNSGNYSNNQQKGNNEQANRNQTKKKNKPSTAYETVTCWFCNRKGHTQIDFRSRLLQNKPLTCKNKELKN